MSFLPSWSFVTALAVFAACAGPRVVPPPESPATPPVQTVGAESHLDAGLDARPADDTLFEQAHDLDLAGRHREAQELYVQLLKESPQSRHAPAAWVAMGDAAFDDAQSSPAKWDEAERFYQQAIVAPPPDNRVYGYAWYKLAHVYWSKRDFARALNALKKTIDFGVSYAQLPDASKLAESARRDVVAVYPEAGNPGAAYNFFRNIAGDSPGVNDKTLVMMEGLGERYWDLGKWAPARTVFEDLAARDPARVCAHRVWVKAASDAAIGVVVSRARIEQDVSRCP